MKYVTTVNLILEAKIYALWLTYVLAAKQTFGL